MLEFQGCLSLLVWPGPSHSTSLDLSFVICKLGMVIPALPTLQSCGEGCMKELYKVLC